MGEAKRKKKVPTDRPTESLRPAKPEVLLGKHRFLKTKDGFSCLRCGTQVMQTHAGWVKKIGTSVCVRGGT